jgi:hypothetical protein
VFTLKSCAHIAGTHVLSFDTEKELLEKWGDFIRLVGYFSSFSFIIVGCFVFLLDGELFCSIFLFVGSLLLYFYSGLIISFFIPFLLFFILISFFCDH